MMSKYFISLAAMTALAIGAHAAEPKDVKVPHKVNNVTLVDLDGKSTTLPMWGEKNLLIFYVDPDKHKQNEDFTVELENNHRASGDNIYGFGIVNIKDSWYPVSDDFIRKMARKRTEKNGATVITDPDHTIADQWQLGDCNNQFVLMIVSKEGELVFVRKGELTAADKAEFYKVVEKYK